MVSGGNKPYFETRIDNTIYRRFEGTVENTDLVWHRDANNRQIIVKESQGWQLQLDNELPQDLVEGNTYFIKAEQYHRLIKGQSDLVIEIIEEE